MSSIGDLLSNLHDDILLQILNKLPAEALIKLISVSKQFKSLIRNPQFIEAHLSSSSIENDGPKQYLLSHSYSGFLVSNSPNYSCWNSMKDPVQLLPEYLLQDSRFIGNSARGVVCLKQNDTHDLILWNPSICKFRIVPNTLTDSDRTEFRIVYGFGFDHVNVDFKVVQLSYNHHGSENGKAMVYEAKSGLWKSIATHVPCYVDTYYCNNCVHVNGVVYWLANKTSTGHYTTCIMGFDLVNEAFKVLELPNGQHCRILSDILLKTSSDGKSLAFFGGHHCYYNTSWNVWYFSKDCVWEKQHDLSLDDRFHPLCILDDLSLSIFVIIFADNATGVVNGVKEGAARFSATEVSHSSKGFRSSAYDFTSYTPSLAFLLE